jgi:hypothetical protein
MALVRWRVSCIGLRKASRELSLLRVRFIPSRIGCHRNLFRFGPERTVLGPKVYPLKEIPMGKKLYVGNLSYSVDSSELEQLFSPHGQVVSAQIINDRDTGRSKGFGFVEMATDQEATAAVTALNGQQHNGRALTVNEARPREERGGGGGGGGGGRGGYGGGGGGGGRGFGGGGGGGRGGYGGGGGGRGDRGDRGNRDRY